MRNSLLEIVLKHSFRGDLDLGFSDAVLTEIVADKLNIPGVVAIDILGMDKHLKVRAFLGVSRKISKKEEITLEYEGFRSDGNAALLVFNLMGSKVIKMAIMVGIKSYEFISLKDEKLVVDFYKMKLLEDNKLIIDYVKSLRDIRIDFSPGAISIKVKLINDKLAV